MTYTLGTAATAVGINKSTVLRAIRSGKISAAKDEHGNWSIDPAELHRVYPPLPLQLNGNGAEQRDAIPDETPVLIATLQATIADLRADRDAWREQAQRLALPDRNRPCRSRWHGKRYGRHDVAQLDAKRLRQVGEQNRCGFFPA
jgi:hypothetical protein